MPKKYPYAIKLAERQQLLYDPNRPNSCNGAALASEVDEMLQAIAIWNKFVRAGVDKSTFTLKSAIKIAKPVEKTFNADSPVNDFFCWFEEQFNVDVKKDFAYKTPWPGATSCDCCANYTDDGTHIQMICLRCRRQYVDTSRYKEKLDMWEYTPQ